LTGKAHSSSFPSVRRVLDDGVCRRNLRVD
jgi:hypothetical protein